MCIRDSSIGNLNQLDDLVTGKGNGGQRVSGGGNAFAVSYTHLDVYKRQVIICGNACMSAT